MQLASWYHSMLALRIIGTVFVAFSCITTLLKNCAVFKDISDDSALVRRVGLWTIYGWLWRAFVIVALWLLH